MPTRRATLLLPCLAIAQPALAQSAWPSRPVRLLVPFPPGGTTDVLARAIAAKWQESWGQHVVVDNRGGGGGVIGTEAAFRAAPDGLTLVLGNNQTHATNGALIPGLPYDPSGFAAISLVARAPHALVVPASSPARTVAELVELGRRPGPGLSYASSSAGSSSHLMSETFSRRNGMRTTHVPYRGAAPAALDLVAGTVDFMMATWASVSALAADGRIRALGVGGEARFLDLPEVPTLREQGYDYISGDAWFGLFAPRGTPGAVLQAVHAATHAALSDATVRGRLEAAGFRIATMPPDEFAAFHQAEVARWAALVRESGVTLAN
ncbi:Bug family tripartite tricarboxylate transporter substrate binding protein [Falsiroseomonas tokyonensis]|uniref:Bug family tripartite tricarboxylate transporter substrate binding protein n=1 Tax=Falsiroseomonas tokyonensis TaxID=430521 RepID=A0ABV7BW14_9PROT|nr:tripartite tricarboxylate transporter substrate-binding protein [Falsiroseomonas tokyonensis]MBU8538367.1 tripartite tricarboxylate transporter substrate binding protein [Falsiroseomonas tokyonensis]